MWSSPRRSYQSRPIDDRTAREGPAAPVTGKITEAAAPHAGRARFGHASYYVLEEGAAAGDGALRRLISLGSRSRKNSSRLRTPKSRAPFPMVDALPPELLPPPPMPVMAKPTKPPWTSFSVVKSDLPPPPGSTAVAPPPAAGVETGEDHRGRFGRACEAQRQWRPFSDPRARPETGARGDRSGTWRQGRRDARTFRTL